MLKLNLSNAIYLCLWATTSKPCLLDAGYAERTAKNQFKITEEEPGFSATGGLKDATHVQNLAKQSGCSMPVVDIVVDNLTQVKERSDAGALDWAALALITREKAGVKDDQKLLK